MTNIQLTLAGTQNGFTIAFVTVYPNIQGGNAYVILNYYDGTSTRFDDYCISSLGGNSYQNINSIEIYMYSSMANEGASLYATTDRSLDPYGSESSGFDPDGTTNINLVGNYDIFIYPTADLTFTFLDFELWD